MEEYEAYEPKRLASEKLQTNEFYFLGLPNRTGYPDAYRALVQVENLQWTLGRLALEVRYYTRDLLPYTNNTTPSKLENNYWLPNKTLELAMPDGREVRVDQGFFIPYESPLDGEFKKVKESLAISDLLDNYV